MKEVPEPKTEKGVIESLQLGGRLNTIDYKGITENEVARYIEDLKAAGFSEGISESKSETRYSFHAGYAGEEASMLYTVDVSFKYDAGTPKMSLRVTDLRR